MYYNSQKAVFNKIQKILFEAREKNLEINLNKLVVELTLKHSTSEKAIRKRISLLADTYKDLIVEDNLIFWVKSDYETVSRSEDYLDDKEEAEEMQEAEEDEPISPDEPPTSFKKEEDEEVYPDPEDPPMLINEEAEEVSLLEDQEAEEDEPISPDEPPTSFKKDEEIEK